MTKDNIFSMKWKIYLTTIVFAVLISIVPKTSHAALLGVPISTSLDYQSTMNYQKNFTLDKIATMIAKQILHSMTADVVNWINGGFEGSPMFLNDPGAFFLDAADQVTGAFLATNGPLSSLCEPFKIDLTLSLALNQTAFSSQRYTCTLGRIIEAQKNGPDLTINGRTVNSSMNGFLGGDFAQGGWPAFIALTTEPQNNPYDAALTAKADLRARVGERQNTIKADLSLGGGFMSWKKCSNIPGGTVSNEDEAAYADELTAGDPSVRIKKNNDGTETYQTCETQTPGSVISGTLQKNLNVPATELELADDINAVVNALVTQMITKMITGGLGGLSGGSSSGPSATQQIITDINSGREVQSALPGLQENIARSMESIDTYVASYEKLAITINENKSLYLAARSCFEDKIKTAVSEEEVFYLRGKVSGIDSTIETKINIMLNNWSTAKDAAANDRKILENISFALVGTNSTSVIQTQTDRYTAFIQGSGSKYAGSIDTNIKAQTDVFNADAAQLLGECKRY